MSLIFAAILGVFADNGSYLRGLDRMLPDNDVLTIDQLQLILPAQYGHIRNLRFCSPNQYVMETATGTFLLSLCAKTSPAKRSFNALFLDYLQQKGLPFPKAFEIFDYTAHRDLIIINHPEGRPTQAVTSEQCFAVGQFLGRFHEAGQLFEPKPGACRDEFWRQESIEQLQEYIPISDALLLQEELGFQKSIDFSLLPQGTIHGFFTVENGWFTGAEITQVTDFSHFCFDNLLLDVGIAANHWCRDISDTKQALSPSLTDALLAGYETIRPFTILERQRWPHLRRTGAFYCWLSSLLARYFPDAHPPLTHDPEYFKSIIKQLSEVPRI